MEHSDLTPEDIKHLISSHEGTERMSIQMRPSKALTDIAFTSKVRDRRADSKCSLVTRRTNSASLQGRAYKEAVLSKILTVNKFKKLEADSESEEEEDREQEDETKWRGLVEADFSLEFIRAQNIINYLKYGDRTVTVLALCLLENLGLSKTVVQIAIKNTGGLEVLLNLLDTDDTRCQIGALQVLRDIASNPFIREKIVEYGGLKSMVNLLVERSLSLRALCAETIARVAKSHKSAAVIRWWGGIPYLIELLDVPEHLLNPAKPSGLKSIEVEAARCGALALWSLSRSTKNKRLIRYCGAVPLLARLVKCSIEDLLIPVVGTLQECASLDSFRLAIRVEGILDYFRYHLDIKNLQLQTLCSSAIFKCAEDEESRESIGKQGVLKPLVELIADPTNRNSRELVSSVAGALWKSALSIENVKRMLELGAIPHLVDLLHQQPDDVLINAVGAIGLCAKLPKNAEIIRKAGGMKLLVQLLTSTNEKLLFNVAQAVGIFAEDLESIPDIEELEATRLLWSQLRNRSPDVQASAAWALCPCVRNVKDSGHLVRSFVGGMESLMGLFLSKQPKVLSPLCALLCEVARDKENIGVLTDYGVVTSLSELCRNSDANIRHHLAGAIAACCPWGDNCKKFGDKGVVPPLVEFVQSKDENLQLSSVKALYQLSLEPANCVRMHSCGAVKYLINHISSENEQLQENAAYCMKNIRTLAMAVEHLKNGWK